MRRVRTPRQLRKALSSEGSAVGMIRNIGKSGDDRYVAGSPGLQIFHIADTGCDETVFTHEAAFKMDNFNIRCGIVLDRQRLIDEAKVVFDKFPRCQLKSIGVAMASLCSQQDRDE
jgi:hypothetical protein